MAFLNSGIVDRYCRLERQENVLGNGMGTIDIPISILK